LELANPVSIQAMRDGIVKKGVFSRYTLEVIHFAAWARSEHAHWFT
jgi:hypothetical protein